MGKKLINLIKTYNPHEPVKEIVAILHKYKIPISAVNQVFELVQNDIQKETIPYNPKEHLSILEILSEDEGFKEQEKALANCLNEQYIEILENDEYKKQNVDSKINLLRGGLLLVIKQLKY